MAQVPKKTSAKHSNLVTSVSKRKSLVISSSSSSTTHHQRATDRCCSNVWCGKWQHRLISFAGKFKLEIQKFTFSHPSIIDLKFFKTELCREWQSSSSKNITEYLFSSKIIQIIHCLSKTTNVCCERVWIWFFLSYSFSSPRVDFFCDYSLSSSSIYQRRRYIYVRKYYLANLNSRDETESKKQQRERSEWASFLWDVKKFVLIVLRFQKTLLLLVEAFANAF